MSSIWYLYRSEEQGWEPIPASSPGSVMVHASFTSQLNDKGAVDPNKRVADLAVVILAHELNGVTPDIFLRSQEVSENDELIVIGYGPTKKGGKDEGG